MSCLFFFPRYFLAFHTNRKYLKTKHRPTMCTHMFSAIFSKSLKVQYSLSKVGSHSVHAFTVMYIYIHTFKRAQDLDKGRLFHCNNIVQYTFVMFKECSISFKEVQYYFPQRSSTCANVADLTRGRPAHCNKIGLQTFAEGSLSFKGAQNDFQRNL